MMNTSSRRSTVVSTAGLVLLGLALAPAVGCTVDTEPVAGENVDSSVMTFEEFMDVVYQEPETGIYIVDGDTPIQSYRELEAFYAQYVQGGSLAIYTSGGADVKWSDAQKLNLTYCVSTTFGTNYNAVVSAMNSATAAWEAVANVNFIHSSNQDSNCTASNNNVVFDVRPVSGGGYLARAFFPNTARSGRNVLIDSTSFGSISPWTLAGILRHELGHTLGFRHEHTRPEAGTCFEDNNWRGVTTYDSASVMHYPHCGGSQTGDLVLTQKDKDGAASVYPFGGASCAHDKCVTGVALNAAACGTAVQSVCAADPYCCTTSWDSICVGEVYSVAGSVKCSTGSCAHGLCATGTKLTAGCDPNGVVTTICNADSYCCSTSWDSYCVSEVSSIAGKNCN